MRLHHRHSGAFAPEDVDDLLEAAGAFESVLDVDHGTVVRQLADLLKRRHRFELLRRQLDYRQRRVLGRTNEHEVY
jgi:hypothetical protein